METDMDKTESETEHTDNGFEIRPTRTSARNTKKNRTIQTDGRWKESQANRKRMPIMQNRIKDTQKLKKEIMETNSRCKAMEKLVTEYEREIDTITAECKKLERERKEAKKTITDMSKQIIEKDKMLQKTQKTITEIRDQMRGNAQQPGKSQEMDEQMPEQHTIHMITDSNGKRITPHLKENNRVNIAQTYRTEDINENIHADKIRIKNADTVIMMVGTNNIREGEEAKENRNRISEAIDNLAEIRGTYANIITIKPPPIVHRRKAREIEMTILGSQIVEMIDNKKTYTRDG